MNIVLRRFAFAGAAFVAALNPPLAFAQKPSPQDEQFVQDAARGGMQEVHMGRLGLERGGSQAVKRLSQRLTNDHTKSGQELAALAKGKGIALAPDDAQTISAMPLAKMQGADFDREFAKAATADHEKDIAAFEKEASSGTDPDIRNWARQTLPTLRAHLADARALLK